MKRRSTLNYRQLLALYQVSERLFRRWQMLLFRVVCLAVGVLRVWKTWGDIQAGRAVLHPGELPAHRRRCF